MAKKLSPGEGLNDDQQAALVQIGKMMGPHATGFDDRVQQMHDEAHADEHASTDYNKVFAHFPGEASAQKMHAAQTGGATEPLGPSDIEQAQVKQQSAGRQRASNQSALQAKQAQAQDVGPNAPPAPTGPVGVTAPYPAQAGPQPQPPAQQPPMPGAQAAPPPPGGPPGASGGDSDQDQGE